MIDAHVHLLPEEFRKGYKPPKSEKVIRSTIYDHPQVDKVFGKTSCEYLIRSMNKNGISKTVIMGFPWNSPDLCEINNEYIKSCVARYPHRLDGVAVVQPKGGRKTLKRIEKYIKDDGFVGVKIIPHWQGYQLGDSVMDPMMNLITELKTVLVTHVDQPFKGFSYDHPHHLLSLAAKFPKTRILCDHLGGLLCLYNVHKPVKKLIKNLYFLTTVAHTMKFVEFASQCVEKEKLLFGTDNPFIYPYTQTTVLKEFNKLKIPATLKRQIGKDNAIKLFNLKER